MGNKITTKKKEKRKAVLDKLSANRTSLPARVLNADNF